MVRLTLVMVAIFAVGGCKTENKAFCDDPANAGLQGCSGDASNGGSCSAKTDCKDMNFPACDTDKKTCVQCFGATHDLCSGMTPRCEADTCVACVDDHDCNDTGVCLLNGACADPNKIIHAVATGGSPMNTCGSTTMPCTVNEALMLVTSSRDIIKLGSGTYSLMGGLHPSSEVTIDARGAVIARSDNGSVVTVDSSNSVTLIGGTIHGDSGRNGDGIDCNTATLTLQETSIETNDQAGLNLNNCIASITSANIHDNSKKPGMHFPAITVQGGTLTLSRSMILSNTGGGLSILNGDFTIVGNILSGNGQDRMGSDPGSGIGGVFINASGANDRFDFNTITQNKAQQDTVPGVQCTNGGLRMTDNIIYNNISVSSNPLVPVAQTIGNCTHSYSDIKDSLPTNSNLQVDPMLDATFHLPANSALKGKADPSTSLTGIAAKDIDGDARAKRPNMGADIGADQIRGP